MVKQIKEFFELLKAKIFSSITMNALINLLIVARKVYLFSQFVLLLLLLLLLALLFFG